GGVENAVTPRTFAGVVRAGSARLAFALARRDLYLLALVCPDGLAVAVAVTVPLAVAVALAIADAGERRLGAEPQCIDIERQRESAEAQRDDRRRDAPTDVLARLDRHGVLQVRNSQAMF